MAFTAASNFRDAWSEATTTYVNHRLVFAPRMNAAYDGDAETNNEVYAQNPNYKIAVQKPALKAAWGTPSEPEASRITIAANQPYRVESTLYVQDELVNAVRDYRARLETAALDEIAVQVEKDRIAYLATLKVSATATDNGNAGGIRQISKGLATADAAVGFSISTGMPTGNTSDGSRAADVRNWVQEAIKEGLVKLTQKAGGSESEGGLGGPAIGGMISEPWCILPVELAQFGLLDSVEAQGLSLPVTERIIATNTLSGAAGPVAEVGVYRGVRCYMSTLLTAPADDTKAAAGNVWRAWMGMDDAVAAPLRRLRNYVTEPQNASAERYEFRHTTEGGVQLVNSNSIIALTFDASD